MRPLACLCRVCFSTPYKSRTRQGKALSSQASQATKRQNEKNEIKIVTYQFQSGAFVPSRVITANIITTNKTSAAKKGMPPKKNSYAASCDDPTRTSEP